MRTLGIDVGERRVGLALSDPSDTLATPLRALQSSGGGAQRLAALIACEIDRLAAEEEGLGRVVVGLPVGLDGRPHAQTARVTSFVEALRRRTGVPIALQDERFTSREAERRLALREPDWRRRRRRLDAAAAAVMLQGYLDGGRPANGGGPGG